MTDSSQVKMIGIICKGNILRSQVLQQYLQRNFRIANIPEEVFSCGISEDSYENEHELLREVEKELQARGILATLSRRKWDQQVAKMVSKCGILFVPDRETMQQVIKKSGDSESKMNLVYRFINEGDKDFADTYDYTNKRQDPVLFKMSFGELERIAELIFNKLMGLQ